MLAENTPGCCFAASYAMHLFLQATRVASDAEMSIFVFFTLI